MARFLEPGLEIEAGDGQTPISNTQPLTVYIVALRLSFIVAAGARMYTKGPHKVKEFDLFAHLLQRAACNSRHRNLDSQFTSETPEWI